MSNKFRLLLARLLLRSTVWRARAAAARAAAARARGGATRAWRRAGRRRRRRRTTAAIRIAVAVFLFSHDHLRHVFQVFAQVVRQATEADGGEEVDREPGVLRRILRHDPLEILGHVFILQPLVQLAQSERLGELLEQNLDENTRRRCRRLLRELKIRQARPWDRVRGQKMREELSHVAQLARL